MSIGLLKERLNEILPTLSEVEKDDMILDLAVGLVNGYNTLRANKLKLSRTDAEQYWEALDQIREIVDS